MGLDKTDVWSKNKILSKSQAKLRRVMIIGKIGQFWGLFVFSGVVLSGVYSCSSVDLGALGLQLPGSVKPIQELQSDPDLNSLVYLRGRVGDRIPLIEAQIYQLQDDTGSIWVLTTDPLIESGATVAVQGRVRFESIPLAGQELGEIYIEEQERWE